MLRLFCCTVGDLHPGQLLGRRLWLLSPWWRLLLALLLLWSGSANRPSSTSPAADLLLSSVSWWPGRLSRSTSRWRRSATGSASSTATSSTSHRRVSGKWVSEEWTLFRGALKEKGQEKRQVSRHLVYSSTIRVYDQIKIRILEGKKPFVNSLSTETFSHYIAISSM